MPSVMPFNFDVVDLYTVTVIGKPWMRAREVCQVLKYFKKIANGRCSLENIALKHQISGVTSTSTAANWLKDWQMYDIPINEESKHELLFSSQKSKTKDFKKQCCNCNVMLPYVQQQLTDKMQKDH